MTDEEKRLRNKQEQEMTTAARKALDANDAALALSLIEQASGFWQENLITLMGVIGFHSNNAPLLTRAKSLFGQHLGRCTKIGPLTFPAMWLRNPSRKRVLPEYLRIAIDSHRKALEPAWDGIWIDPGLAATNRGLAILAKQPREVSDPDDCLIGASQASNWSLWFDRYLEVGGDTKNPRYLKLWVSRFVPLDREPSQRIKGMLWEFTKLGDIPEVRRFLRNITPIRTSAEGKNPNRILAERALLLYCECERLGHTLADWVHISKSALHLEHRLVQRIVQCILAESDLDPEAERVLDELERMRGRIQTSQSPLNDIGLRGNPIWQNLHALVPVNADARKILTVYSHRELQSE